VQPIHGPNPAFVTKELDLEEMEHANFDPEVAAAYHEDGLEEADLGYWAGGDYGMGHDPHAEGAWGRHPLAVATAMLTHVAHAARSSALGKLCRAMPGLHALGNTFNRDLRP